MGETEKQPEQPKAVQQKMVIGEYEFALLSRRFPRRAAPIRDEKIARSRPPPRVPPPVMASTLLSIHPEPCGRRAEIAPSSCARAPLGRRRDDAARTSSIFFISWCSPRIFPLSWIPRGETGTLGKGSSIFTYSRVPCSGALRHVTWKEEGKKKIRVLDD